MKTALTSKTIWFGILQIVFAGVGFLFGFIDTDLASALAITGAGTIGLRFKTTQPIE
jgi:hypothetical protein